MSTWFGTILGSTVGTAHGIASATVATVASGGDFSQGGRAYGASQQAWNSAGDALSNSVVNYDVVSPKTIGNGDLFVMWSSCHTYLCLEHAKGYTYWEQCGDGIDTREGGTETDTYYKWNDVRMHNGSHGYIVHHVRANHSVDEVNRARNRIRHKYDNRYCVVARNCHHFCDEMLMELGHGAMGEGYFKTAASGIRNM